MSKCARDWLMRIAKTDTTTLTPSSWYSKSQWSITRYWRKSRFCGRIRVWQWHPDRRPNDHNYTDQPRYLCPRRSINDRHTNQWSQKVILFLCKSMSYLSGTGQRYSTQCQQNPHRCCHRQGRLWYTRATQTQIRYQKSKHNRLSRQYTKSSCEQSWRYHRPRWGYQNMP